MVNFFGGLKAQAVIFDFDGVIVDTEPLHYLAFQRVLEPCGLGFSWGKYIETYMGFDDRDAFVEAFTSRGKQISPDDLSRLILAKAELFQDVIQDGVVPYPGVVELISKLHQAQVPLAICSGALLSDIIPIITMLGIDVHFDIIVTADDVAKSKPHPECYRLAFERLSNHCASSAISPLHTIAIEDTPAGITAALGAGLQVIAVTNSYARERICQATQIVDSLEELQFQITT